MKFILTNHEIFIYSRIKILSMKNFKNVVTSGIVSYT